MMKLTADHLIFGGLLGALATLVLVSVGAYYSTTGLLDNAELVMHTLEVNRELAATLATVTTAESAQRGYLLTSQEAYITAYQAAVPTLAERLKRLRALIADNPKQQQRLNEMEQVAVARQNKLAEVLALHQREGSTPRELLEEGKRLMDELRWRIAEMDTEENQLLNQRQASAAAAARRTLLTIPLGGLLALGVTIIALSAVRRESVRRQRAEAATQAFTRELERSNRELQDFAYVASHDLQEPLRKIQAFGDLLRNSHSAAFDEEARDFIERMQNAARRMQVLINDLLVFSRVATKREPFTSVDLNQVAREVMNDLEVRLQQSGGSVAMGELPVVEADATQMRQLLQNLIGNALKFRRPDVPPHVTVGAAPLAEGREQEFYELTVEDNGIGFDEKYLDRIFTPFQRLHGRSEYEGTGMGLAVCRRIAERHGGTLTARSQPGQGSRFSITLPATQTDAHTEAREMAKG